MKRGSIYYIRYCIGSKKRKVSTDTDNFQVAKEKLRQFEAAQARGDVSPLPTKTPVADVLTAYVAHIRAAKTAKSAQTDIYLTNVGPDKGFESVQWAGEEIDKQKENVAYIIETNPAKGGP